MKPHCIILALIIIQPSSACRSIPNYNAHSDSTKQWINTHTLPIKTSFEGKNVNGYSYYKLEDAVGEIYSTGPIKIEMPDTIKSIGK